MFGIYKILNLKLEDKKESMQDGLLYFFSVNMLNQEYIIGYGHQEDICLKREKNIGMKPIKLPSKIKLIYTYIIFNNIYIHEF